MLMLMQLTRTRSSLRACTSRSQPRSTRSLTPSRPTEPSRTRLTCQSRRSRGRQQRQRQLGSFPPCRRRTGSASPCACGAGLSSTASSGGHPPPSSSPPSQLTSRPASATRSLTLRPYSAQSSTSGTAGCMAPEAGGGTEGCLPRPGRASRKRPASGSRLSSYSARMLRCMQETLSPPSSTRVSSSLRAQGALQPQLTSKLSAMSEAMSKPSCSMLERWGYLYVLQGYLCSI